MTQEYNGSKQNSDPAQGFPYLTVLATLLTLFLFAALMLLAYHSPYNQRVETDVSIDNKLDPETKLAEIRAKNQAILEGKPESGVRMSLQAAMGELLSKLQDEQDVLPFPQPPPLPPPPLAKGKSIPPQK